MARAARKAATPRCQVSDEGLVVVTGSSGLIGGALVERLAADGFTVVGFDRVGPPHPPPVAECVPIDLRSDESVRAALDRVRYAYGGKIASVVHLAAFYDFSGESSPLYAQVTVQGTRRLLRALQDFDVEQFVFSSTMLVHAPCGPAERIDEDWPLESKWPYPRSKALAEAAIHRARGDIASAILRIAGVYTDRCQSIPLAHQVQRIHERKLISHVFPGDTSHGQAFVHLDDLIDAMVSSVRRRRQLPEETVVLIAEEETLSYETLQRTMGRLIHGEDWETREIPKAIAKLGAWLQDTVPGEEPFIQPWMIDLADDHFAIDASRAKKLLGWRPRRSLLETLPKMVAALREDPESWYRENKLEPPKSIVSEQERGPPTGPTQQRAKARKPTSAPSGPVVGPARVQSAPKARRRPTGTS